MKWKWILLIGIALLVIGGTGSNLITGIADRIAYAIATAEGFFVTGSRPQRNNNPGNLTVDTIGKAVSRDGQFVVYSNIIDGWAALKAQVEMMLNNTSSYYNSAMSILQIAMTYTATNPEQWANNVANSLGVSIYTPIGDIQ